MASGGLSVDFFPATVASTTSEEPSIVYEATATGRGIAALLVGLTGAYCQSVFEALARSSPGELISIIRENRAPDSRLTFAAEILGRDVPTPAAAIALLEILQDHRSPLVREGAVLGLAHHLDGIGVRQSLRAAAEGDPSLGVKRAAAEVLDD